MPVTSCGMHNVIIWCIHTKAFLDYINSTSYLYDTLKTHTFPYNILQFSDKYNKNTSVVRVAIYIYMMTNNLLDII